ncbi:right-handed parallel beta-helix repeat-containing protein [Streptomyces sp. NPDC059828]|uniref:right-handed parallel beta-helix repeat-containing protein n=1 Tax=Streptomyces sp. NPDC059828 TaxID=3346965 RepID=UPI00364E3F89
MSAVRCVKSAVLGRHWRAAVIAAAGFATMVGTSTVAVVAGAGAAEAHAPSPVAGGEGGKDAEGKESKKESKGDKGGHDKGKGGHDKGDKGGHEGRGEDGGGKKWGGDHEDDGKEYVECDPNALVAALVELNENRGGDLVLAKDCTYTLTTNLDGNGLPRITQPISIFGHGATIARAANADQFRLFEVGPGGDLKLRKLTLTRGKAAAGDEGGAIRVSPAGRLELDDVTVRENGTDILADNDAGGLQNDGIATVRNSVFHRNSGEDGAAIANNDAKIEIIDSEITGNIADPDDGFGALYNSGTMRVRDSLISHNDSVDGGGVHNDGVLEIENSTIAHNFAADDGGAIDSDDGPLYLRDSVVKGNTAAVDGGGLSLTEPASVVGSEIVDNALTASEATGAGVFVSMGGGEDATSIRDSKIIGNQAPGNAASGGGIFNVENDGELRLTDVKVARNLSDDPAGGVNNNGTLFTYGKVRIIDNVPTNCDGGGSPVPNCFG